MQYIYSNLSIVFSVIDMLVIKTAISFFAFQDINLHGDFSVYKYITWYNSSL